MAMAERIPMPIDDLPQDALLTLAQWFSPSFPIGAFSYSHGLEWLVHSGAVHDADSFEAWIVDVVRQGAGRTDLIMLAQAYDTPHIVDLIELDALARALSPSAERLLETSQQGAAFVRTIVDVWSLNLPTLSLPVAIGVAAKAMRLPLHATARLYLHSVASNLVAAAIRLVPLGQTEGQKCLSDLSPLINETADTALRQNIDDIGSTAFAVDIASMCHETQYSRMFRS
jgi:urease accessory protein